MAIIGDIWTDKDDMKIKKSCSVWCEEYMKKQALVGWVIFETKIILRKNSA